MGLSFVSRNWLNILKDFGSDRVQRCEEIKVVQVKTLLLGIWLNRIWARQRWSNLAYIFKKVLGKWVSEMHWERMSFAWIWLHYLSITGFEDFANDSKNDSSTPHTLFAKSGSNVVCRIIPTLLSLKFTQYSY